MRFFRSPSTFLAITSGTRTDDVLPGRLSPLTAGDDVVEGRFLGV